MIIFLKCIIILCLNILLGWFIAYSLHFYLFYPRKIFFFNKYRFYFSPGLIYRKKEKLITYLHDKVNEYYQYVNQDYIEINFLTNFENKMYDEIFSFIKKYLKREWIPEFIRSKVMEMISWLLWMGIRYLTRTFIPRYILEHKLHQKIDILDIKLDVNKLKKYYEEYIYKNYLYFNLVFFTVIGLINMVLFIILN